MENKILSTKELEYIINILQGEILYEKAYLNDKVYNKERVDTAISRINSLKKAQDLLKKNFKSANRRPLISFPSYVISKFLVKYC